ncbi:MAG TPA: hypothetical protein VN577_20220 [Terriglobales bacterium]|nr:hypothetical protein [Terriglobales bacterium]
MAVTRALIAAGSIAAISTTVAGLTRPTRRPRTTIQNRFGRALQDGHSFGFFNAAAAR